MINIFVKYRPPPNVSPGRIEKFIDYNPGVAFRLCTPYYFINIFLAS